MGRGKILSLSNEVPILRMGACRQFHIGELAWGMGKNLRVYQERREARTGKCPRASNF